MLGNRQPSYEVWQFGPGWNSSPQKCSDKIGDSVVTEVMTLKCFDGSFHSVPDIAGTSRLSIAGSQV